MIIDTTKHISAYEDPFKKIYFNNYLYLRKKFCTWLDRIGSKKNLDWWISTPASRNFNYSKLFHYICIVESIKILKKNNKIKKIIVENKDLEELINKNFNLNISRNTEKKKNINFLNNFSIIFKTFFFHSIIYFFCKLKHRKKLYRDKKFILVDTFINSSEVETNRFYSNKFISVINSKKNILLIPAFFMGMGLTKIFKIIKDGSKNKKYLFREQYLNFYDIINSFLFIYRRNKLIRKHRKFNNVDYSTIINSEIKTNINLSSQILGLQNYYFFKNLHNSKIKIKKTINWFENQPLDKGWNYGSRIFYPNSKSLGYQAVTYFPQYMCLNPTKEECLSKVVPETILSIGVIYNATKKEFYNNIKVENAPALAYQYLYKKKNTNILKNNNKRILIILSGFLDDDISLLKWIIKSNVHKKEHNILIKEHPILKFEEIKKHFNFIPKNFNLSKKNFVDSVNESNFLICSGATSAVLELVVQGKYCIIPKLNPFDEVIFKRLKISNNFKVLDNPLKLNKSFNKPKIKKYKINNFFTKLTKKNIKIFL